jgi:hypothetical protein
MVPVSKKGSKLRSPLRSPLGLWASNFYRKFNSNGGQSNRTTRILQYPSKLKRAMLRRSGGNPLRRATMRLDFAPTRAD